MTGFPRLTLAVCTGDTPSLHDPCTAPEAPLHDPCTPPDLSPETLPPFPWERATQAQRERALRRLLVVERSDALVSSGASRADADTAAAVETGASISAVRGWRKRTQGLPEGERLAALLDLPGRGRPRREWSGEGAEALWAIWQTDWLREEAPDAAAVHRRIAGVAEARGGECPPIQAFLRWTRREVPRAELVRAREGALAAMDLVPYQTRTVAGLRPLSILNGDGRKHDLIVRFPSGRDEGRPCVWYWQDVWSRRILAWRAGETESADLVRLSLHELIVKHGVPGRVLTDNTLAASAKGLTGGKRERKRHPFSDGELPGLLAMLDIQYSTTVVDMDAAGKGKGRGRSKPIERALGDLARQIDTHPSLAGSYTGRSPVDRPETHRSRPAKWEDFLSVVGAVVIEHNARLGRDTEIAAGRSFDEAWKEGIREAVIRRITPAQAAILLLAAEGVKVQRDGTLRLKAGKGIGLPANRYHHPDLVERAGEKLVARFDPRKLHDAVHVYDREGRYVCQAGCLHSVGFGDTAGPRYWERARKGKRRAAEKGLAARRDMDALRDALHDLPRPEEPVEPEPAATRLVVGGDLPDLPGSSPRKRGATIVALKKLHGGGGR